MLVAQCRPHRPRLIPPPPSLFLSGRLSVLRALLRVRALFNRGDRYILNSLYIEDYLCWLQVKYLSFLCFIILSKLFNKGNRYIQKSLYIEDYLYCLQ